MSENRKRGMAILVLVRHGQSVWNALNEFTGWVDVPITKEGDIESRQAGARLLRIPFDVAFTSQLIRAHQTLCTIFQERTDRILVFKHATGQQSLWEHYSKAKAFEIPVFISQALNERYYGDLQGLDKEETKQKYGEEQVHIWRRSYDVAPPGGESLKDTIARALPYFEQHILPFIVAGKNVIVVAHGNSLRSIMMHLEKLTPEQVLNLELPTAVPVMYLFDASGKPYHKEMLL
jgi:2,3-bisphosphoglycerate-dependent phosphoglycerate mutase